MKNNSTTARFLFLFAATALVLAAVAFSGARYEASHRLETLKTVQNGELELASNSIERDFASVFSDLYMLASNEDLLRYINNGTRRDILETEQQFLVLSKAKKRYDQVRYLDANGMEVIRVNYNHGSPRVVPSGKLQNKADRYYFREAARLRRNEIFVSPFDLNVEHGKIEKPHKPMIRFGMPIFDRRGRNKGVLVLNYSGAVLIDDLKLATEHGGRSVMLLNREGYWLIGPDPADEWGFMFHNQRSFAHRYPAEWKQIASSRQGSILTSHGLFTFATVYPLLSDEYIATGVPLTAMGNKGQVQQDQYCWKVVSYVPKDMLPSGSLHQHPTIEAIFYLALMLAFASSVVLARAWTARSRIQQKLEHLSLHDALTGLANRVLLEDRLGQALAQNRRHDRLLAVIYLDLDGFKDVNDRYGHNVGDALLVSLSQRMKAVLREGDTLARMGGDEFAAVLVDLESMQSCEQVVTRLLQAAAEPLTVEGIRLQISASIGVTLYPWDHGDTDLLLRHADQAMYVAKQSGKNCYQVFEAG